MSGKTYWFIAGLVTAIAVPILIHYKKQEKLFIEEDLTQDGSELLDSASYYLRRAKDKANKMINDAEAESTSILEVASKTLSSAKEKTTKIHEVISSGSKDEILKLKEELEKEIEKYKDNTF